MKLSRWAGLFALAAMAGASAQEDAAPAAAEESAAPLATVSVSDTEVEAPAATDATELDIITVTSSKRVKAQRDLPGSVGALRGEDLERIQAQGMKDYLKLIPGVSFADQGSDASVPIIRGIATEIGFGFTAQTTGIYLDDMPFADLLAPLSLPDLNPFDLERVEVLKGPQGTLFGSGALAGAVRYIAQKPQHSVWEAKLSLTGAQVNSADERNQVISGAFNLPLFGDAVAVRAVSGYRDDSGLYDRGAAGPNGNSLRDGADADVVTQSSGRVLASWNASDRLKLSAFYFGQKTERDDVAYADQPQRRASGFNPFASPRSDEFGGGNLLATYEFDWGTLLSSTNRMVKNNRILDHAEWFFGLEQQNAVEWYDQIVGEVRGFTQELRLSSPEGGDAGDWDWIVGVSHLNYDGFLFQYEPNPAPVGSFPPPHGPEVLSTAERATSFIFATVNSDATEQAVFGEATRRLGERWEVTAGARAYRTRLITDTVLSGGQIVALVQKTEDRQHFEPESDGVNPKFAVRYLYSRNVQAYALAAKGFQFGGIQLNPPSTLFVQSTEDAGFKFGPYDSSSLWNYEGGLRTEWLDRRLRFDLTYFYLDWKDLQLTVLVPLAGTDAQIGVITNVGSAHSEGVEAALEVLPFPGGRFSSSAAWISALTDEAFDGDNPAGPVRAGTRLPGSPRFQWANAFAYERALPYFSNWTGGLAVTHVHTGASPDAIRPTGEIGGYDTLDARLSLAKSDSRFQPELGFAINNLTDVRGVTFHGSRANLTGEVFNFYHFVPPRTALLTLSMRY